jgi:hypothetical protein
MTWGKAAPILALAAVVDASRIFFTMFWLFGPALAVAYCANQTSGFLGTYIGKAACAAGAAAVGYFGAPALITFGTVMAMAVGLMGFLLLGFLLLAMNSRMFTVNASSWLWLTGGLGVSVVPFIGSLPAFSAVLYSLYRRQIKIERANRKKWERANAQRLRQERTQAALREQQRLAYQAANDEPYAPEAEEKSPE